MDLEYIEQPINTVGLVAYYKLWAGLTSTAKVFDYSLNGFTGAVTGAEPVYPGFSMNGTSDFIDVAAGPTSVKSTFLWVKPDDIAGSDYPIGLNPTDYLSIVTGTLTKTGFAGGTTALYVDGVAGTSVTADWHLIGITDTLAKNANEMQIGSVSGPPIYFGGLIGETMLFDRVLSPEEVKSLYETTRRRYSV